MENRQGSEINDEFLLQCVANYKPLYDKTDRGYKSILQKENCWANVARSLQTTVPVVKARFKALREKYRREVAIEEKLSRSGAPSTSRPTWSLMSFFKFMYRYGQEEHRATTSNMDNDESESQQEVWQELSDNENIEEVIIYEEPGTSQTNEHTYYSQLNEEVEGNREASDKTPSVRGAATPTIKKRKVVTNTSSKKETQEIDNVLKDVSSAIMSINQRVPQSQSGDKFDHFGKYLALEIKGLGEPHSSILMEQIQMQVINFKRSLRQKRN